MLEDESRVHETVKCVYPWETEEEKICGYVRAEVKSELGKKFPDGHTGCLSAAVVEAISANIYFDKKKEFPEDRAGADVYLQNHAGNSSYAVAFTENGKKYWMIHCGYDALPTKMADVQVKVERPSHMGCCGE
ncbi:MAG: hypothetical protein IJ601_07125 [Acidaminococcaceae bacterium]|nr:hypothetical protein [Acidaminococcaceae bacterium]